MEFHFPEVHDAIAAAIPEREAIVFRDRRITYGQLAERSRRLANYLHSRGLGEARGRSGLPAHESGQDHLAIYLHNGNEYVEAMLGAFKARVAPLNVNYRYIEEELLYLFTNARPRAVVYHSAFAPRVAALRRELRGITTFIQVADGSGYDLLPGAVAYDDVIASSSPDPVPVEPSPDDLYILYTGGTTGLPKGVLWRSADIFVAAMGGRKQDGTEFSSIDQITAQADASGGRVRSLIGPPFMHGAAQWVSFMILTAGGTLVLPSVVERLDADDVLTLVERERCLSISIVGDAFARPLIDQMSNKRYDLSGLFLIGSGGAPLSTANKRAFLEHIPNVTIMDGIGSSETGAQGVNPSSKAAGVSTGRFTPGPGACVVSADLRRVLRPGDDEIGWFAQSGRVPLGYFADPEKTARTFPTIEGARYSVPGDRARYRPDGAIEVLGRDAVTINSGGEKIFAEEVEHALKQHPAVYDTVVAGRSSERWGQEVVAIVQVRPGIELDPEDLLAEAAKHIARYKLPKTVLFRESILRSPSGKADYRWAREQVEQG